MSHATRKLHGRPPKPSDSVRKYRVVTFVTESERQRLRDLEMRSGMSLSAVVHDLIAQSLNRRPKRSPNPESMEN